MKTLITGANGFIGSAVMQQLLAAGHDVRVLIRPLCDRRNLAGKPVEIHEGDLRDKDSLKKALKHCDTLFHVAADYRLWIPDPEVMYECNVTGTRNLMLSALDAGVNRIVYTSSVATLGLNMDGTPANEETPVSLTDMIGHYKRSKFLAEEEVKKLIRAEGLLAVIVNPTTPVGPRDIKPTPTGRIILDTMRGRMPAYVDTGLNIVHVDDVAKGHLQALEKGKTGQRYLLGGENLTLKQILYLISGIIQRKPPVIRLPHNLVLPIAWLMERWAGITGHEPRATVIGVQMSKKRMFFSSQKAIDQLGYRYRSGETGIRDAIEWFNANNYH
ncbi:MAG: NAD-dependent dehydratase [Gammaproteobacteria bacterium RBG_16_51_14]|nr:MAG: NAD-dependent dehydratase [Gammaproteobacteria bacterium RBG_16_51_14]